MNTPEELSVVNPMLAPADEVYVMPATQGQIRFWSLDQMHPGNPALNMPLMWQCRGELNVDLLAMAFTHAVRRHEMLRTTFAMVDGKPFADHWQVHTVSPCRSKTCSTYPTRPNRQKQARLFVNMRPIAWTCSMARFWFSSC